MKYLEHKIIKVGLFIIYDQKTKNILDAKLPNIFFSNYKYWLFFPANISHLACVTLTTIRQGHTVAFPNNNK